MACGQKFPIAGGHNKRVRSIIQVLSLMQKLGRSAVHGIVAAQAKPPCISSRPLNQITVSFNRANYIPEKLELDHHCVHLVIR